MLLSIIIPSLNEEKYLPNLLESIKRQGLMDYEIILSDAGSKDKTVKIARKHGCKIIKGGLPATGRNNGAKIAEGKTLLFLDSDLVLPDNFLKTFLDSFEKKNLDIAVCPILPNERKFDKIAYRAYNFWVKKMQKVLAYASQVILVKKEIHEKIGGFDPEIRIGEDHIYARKAKKVAKFGFIETEPIVASSRRFKKDGAIRTCITYILSDIYMIFLGPVKKDIFKYKFDHYDQEDI